MKKIILLAILINSVICASAQWVQKASCPGGSRTRAVSFQIGDKIYVMGGRNAAQVALRDFWEYTISTDTWLHKSNFPGPERSGAVAFVINGTAYIGTGENDNGYLDDLWQYNAATDTWLQTTGLPAGSAQHENQRREAFSFVINGKAYLGGGEGWVFGANQTNNYTFPDLWEFDPLNHTWTTKSGFPDFFGRTMAVAGVINNKAYVGLGCNVDQTVNHQELWEYEPATDTWTAKADFPTLFTTDANAFVINSQLYVAGGVNLNPVSITNKVYNYDPVTDAWTQMSVFNGGSIAGAISVSNDSIAFMGTGVNGSQAPRSDFWEFTTANTGITNPFADLNKTVKIYPNPFSNTTTFELNVDKACTLKIFDAIGKEIQQLNLNASTTIFNRGDLPNGIYFYQIYFEENIIDRGKLIIED